MALLISEKVDFRVNNITKDKLGHFKKRKELIHPEDTTILNDHEPDHRASQLMKGKLIELQEEMAKSTIILKNFNNLFSIITKISIQAISKNMEGLNNTQLS